ncbi:hypothetical protein I302_107753 [Kwoniella bestiolae CBS 10118]|uniref:Uncharacterized protein n=1 Tax=Kwoniella bestiolae CBS 10118 TaxID=1296100 RepID=A0A1B9FXN4_9TREE|nr:hypothetical protein I302_06508 [Kwoniella bestiolae CBS 10118]OCF23525.1 hypothetical protein I302_06508 [Kwoniella bestiolae CBS 10118]
MPLSPPFRPSASSSSSSPPPPSGPLPTLPFEIIRRIIFHRLAISPSYPSELEDSYNPSWDSWNGIKGKQVAERKLEERRDVTRCARGLMSVCKAWKPLVMKYLYSSPYLSTTLPALTSCVLSGDSKWSDINLHTFSIPGRFITLLDLTTIPNTLHATEIRKACLALFPLLPNLTHLKLSPGELPFHLEEVGYAPFVKTLKCLEGVQVDVNVNEDGKDGLVELLKRTTNLEVLSVFGSPAQRLEVELAEVQSLDLPRLHTLKMEDVKSGHLLNCLVSSDLPNLTRLSITPLGDLTNTFQEIHGSKIRSLTYLQSKYDIWPFNTNGTILPNGLIPCDKILDIYPNLQHLSFLIPDYNQLELIISSLRDSPSRPLSTLTIYKWQSSPSTSSADGQPISSRNGVDTLSFLNGLARDPPRGLRRINLDGFRWVKLELGKIALDAGKSGQMRKIAEVLGKVGIELGDMVGRLSPAPPFTGVGIGGGERERVYGPLSGGRRRSSGGQGLIRMNGLGMSGKEGIERGSEEEDGG